MSNKESARVRDGRGRPRVSKYGTIIDRIKKAYFNDALPLFLEIDSKQVASLRRNRLLREFEASCGERFRFIQGEKGASVCLKYEAGE